MSRRQRGTMVAVQVTATIVLVERVTPLVIETCQRLTAEACQRCGVTLTEWRAMTFEQREAALRSARRRTATAVKAGQ